MTPDLGYDYPDMIAVFPSVPGWVFSAAGVPPDVDIDFTNGRAWTKTKGLTTPTLLLTPVSGGGNSYAPAGLTTAATILGIGTPSASAINQVLVELDDGTANNRIQLTDTSTLTSSAVVVSATSVVYNQVGGASFVNGVQAKFAMAVSAAAQNAAFNGAALTAGGAIAYPTGLSTLHIGINQSGGGAGLWSGTISRVALWNSSLSLATLQSLTT